jgi:hypothetical protein
MKTICLLSVCALTVLAAMALPAIAAEPKPAAATPAPAATSAPATPAPAAVPPAAKPEADPMDMPPATVGKLTELVATFYKVLLQKEEPTLQQEKDLFGLDSPLRLNLIARKKGVANEPLILNLFRKNRDLFLPLGKLTDEQYLGAVQLTSPFDFVTSLNQIKGKAPAGRGLVMAMFIHDLRADKDKSMPQRFRTVIFSIEDGKIVADGIWLDGFQGQLTGEKFLERVPEQPKDAAR